MGTRVIGTCSERGEAVGANKTQDVNGENLGQKFLTWVQAIVSCDRNPPGFPGKLALGVRDPSQPYPWCLIDFGSFARVTSVETLPTDLDVAVEIDPLTASALVENQPLPAVRRIVRFGEKSLLDRFIRRYLTKNTIFNIHSIQNNGM